MRLWMRLDATLHACAQFLCRTAQSCSPSCITCSLTAEPALAGKQAKRCASVRAVERLTAAVVPTDHFRTVADVNVEVSTPAPARACPSRFLCTRPNCDALLRMRHMWFIFTRHNCTHQNCSQLTPPWAPFPHPPPPNHPSPGLNGLSLCSLPSARCVGSQALKQVQEVAWVRRSENTVLQALIRLSELHEPLRVCSIPACRHPF